MQTTIKVVADMDVANDYSENYGNPHATIMI
ncbi:hypothetical protein X739_32245 [Mesorhizobium sp. LNHC220B00]|nr:hypothetical protein X739_32245 [Mesorhizobium sp. LNHC220B00]